ncbi:MAG: IS3 family transposase [Flavobacteriaceae bacterium]|nr:MAG: IS3 family transposase [Flavobacteriaceae bacterium]
MKFPVEKMCQILGVSKSGYYNWLSSGTSKLWLENQKLSIEIHAIFEMSHHSYRSPRIKTELEALDYNVSKPPVAHIMKANHLHAVRTRKFKATSDSKHNYLISPNLLNQNFKVKRKNQVWVSDITYIHTKQGWLYLTVIIDLYRRKIVGWSLSDNVIKEDTFVKAWNMAVANNPITKKLIFHFDRGSQ